MFVDYGVADNCKNPYSFGEICVKCGECGRKFVNGVLVVEHEEEVKEEGDGEIHQGE